MIKNRDGTPYELRKPNPLMEDQTVWTDFELHNMSWTPEKSEDKTELKPIKSNFEVRETFLSALDESKKETEVIESDVNLVAQALPEEIQVIEHKPIVVQDLKYTAPAEDNGIEKIFIYLLPAIIRERHDDLYGETYRTIQYGKPSSFEGVILNQGDLALELWTDVNIEIGSILFPRVNHKRWWRVQAKEAKKGGWLLTALPSDHQPSFDF